jgi:hypothetical protein
MFNGSFIESSVPISLRHWPPPGHAQLQGASGSDSESRTHWQMPSRSYGPGQHGRGHWQPACSSILARASPQVHTAGLRTGTGASLSATPPGPGCRTVTEARAGSAGARELAALALASGSLPPAWPRQTISCHHLFNFVGPLRLARPYSGWSVAAARRWLTY